MKRFSLFNLLFLVSVPVVLFIFTGFPGIPWFDSGCNSFSVTIYETLRVVLVLDLLIVFVYEILDLVKNKNWSLALSSFGILFVQVLLVLVIIFLQLYTGVAQSGCVPVPH